MSLMEQIYKTVILERSRHPRHHGTLPEPATHHEGVNPSCGDELRLSLLLEDDGTIRDARFEGHGCAISQASADLMVDAIVGKHRDEVNALAHTFKAMIRGEVHDDAALGELKALSGIRQLHARVKCATLPWTTLETALAGRTTTASDEP